MRTPKLVYWGYGYDKYHFNNWEKYKLNREGFEKLWIVQGGRCAICTIAFAHPVQRDKNKMGVKCFVDHRHKKGELMHSSEPKEVRGLLCFNCNSALGVIREDQSLLKSMDAYLTKHGVSELEDEEKDTQGEKKFYEIDVEEENGEVHKMKVYYD